MNALLIIDMQHAWLDGGTPRFDKQGVIRRLSLAATTMRQRGDQIVFIRHANDDALAGSAGWQVITELPVEKNDVLIDKTACDSFADTALLSRLRQRGCQTLYIGGLATEFCVDTTIRSAASHGFDVVALSDAHTTGDRSHLKAGQIVEHHNWVWANMAAPAGRAIRVYATSVAMTML
ncbi:MAG: isochorismatase family protein [Burkholderiales bacterium]|nr:isochorismatase family protein [Burkholderiales bacterium]